MKNPKIGNTIEFFSQFIFSLVFLLLISEITLRVDWVKHKLAAPGFGSDNRQFEIQLSRLKAISERNEAIDCIFVGDSLTWLDLDPLKFSEGYNNRTGEELNCFNFGIAGLPASGVSVITEILLKDYRPKYLVYGLHANAVVIPPDHFDVRSVVDSSWVRYKTGKFNLGGWLYDKSYFYRYRKLLGQLLKFNQESLIDGSSINSQNLRGFDPKSGQKPDGHSAPDWNDSADRIGFEKYYDYQIYPDNLQGIVNVASYAGKGTDVVMVMMPVQESFYGFFRDGSQDYLDITRTIQASISGTDAKFLSTSGMIQFQGNEWWDYSHLNITGAEHLSYWLGQQVGDLESENQ